MSEFEQNQLHQRDLLEEGLSSLCSSPSKDGSRERSVEHEIKQNGLKDALHLNIKGDYYSYVYDILVRNVRPKALFSRSAKEIDINNQGNKLGFYPLERAVMHKADRIAYLLLFLGADPNTSDRPEHDGILKNTLLRQGYEKNTRLVYFLIKQGANTTGLEGMIFDNALENNDALFLETMLKEGVLSKSDVKKWVKACEVNLPSVKMYRLLQECGADIKMEEGALLLSAVKGGDKEELKYVIENENAMPGSDPDRRFHILKSLLHRGHDEYLDRLGYSVDEVLNALLDTIHAISDEQVTRLWEYKDLAEKAVDKNDKWKTHLIRGVFKNKNKDEILSVLCKTSHDMVANMDFVQVLKDQYEQESSEEEKRNWWQLGWGYYINHALLCKVIEKDLNMEMFKDAFNATPEHNKRGDRDIWKDTKQALLMWAVKRQDRSDVSYLVEELETPVSVNILQMVMRERLGNSGILGTLLRGKKFKPKKALFCRAYDNNDVKSFKNLLRPYLGDDADWEVINDNVIVHYQGQETERTHLRTVFNFASDLMSTTIYEREESKEATLKKVDSFTHHFAEIKNDTHIRQALQKLKERGKNPPDNIQTGDNRVRKPVNQNSRTSKKQVQITKP